MNTVLRYVIAAAICLSAGAIGGVATAGAVRGWYTTIAVPSWNPPAWVFGPVWTVLYVFMGISLARVWGASHEGKKLALWVFFVQLILNAVWSLIFFGLQNPGLAAIEIIVLLAAIIYTIRLMGNVDRLAGALLVPYACWVSFATVLNITIWSLNS